MSVATFAVETNDQKVEITVTPLGGNGGGRLPNVNRWRGQLELPPVDEAELDRTAEKVMVGGIESEVFYLVGEAEPKKAIYAALLFQPDRSWFIKLMGDEKLAAEQKASFVRFVESITFH